MSSHVSLVLQQMSLIHRAMGIDVSVGHDDATDVSLNLRGTQIRMKVMLVALRTSEFRYEILTIKRVSHKVPDPLRRTSSGLRGMMLHREKIKGWTYFMYR